MIVYCYDAWGAHKIKIIERASEDVINLATLNPFLYRSYYYDGETGLYYLKARYYDPEVGRFLNMDSVAYADPETINGLNLYVYCNNNPVMNVDPEGTKPQWYEWFLSSVLLVCGVAACFIPGGQGLGAALVVSGISMTTANIMSAAGVNGQIAGIVSSGINIVAGAALCFTPFAGLGASFIGSGVCGIAGGYISEALGGRFETGVAIGSIIGGFAGGRIFDYVKFSQIAKQGVLIGKIAENFAGVVNSMGLAHYSGLSGYRIFSTVLGDKLASQLGWAHNYHYIYNVMKYGGRIYSLGGPMTGSYGKEIALLWRHLYQILCL